MHVQMLRSLFMVEDLKGVYSGWVEGDEIEQQVVNFDQIRRSANYGKFANITLYAPLTKEVPK